MSLTVTTNRLSHIGTSQDLNDGLCFFVLAGYAVPQGSVATCSLLQSPLPPSGAGGELRFQTSADILRGSDSEGHCSSIVCPLTGDSVLRVPDSEPFRQSQNTGQGAFTPASRGIIKSLIGPIPNKLVSLGMFTPVLELCRRVSAGHASVSLCSNLFSFQSWVSSNVTIFFTN